MSEPKKLFYLDDYIENKHTKSIKKVNNPVLNSTDKLEDFNILCIKVKKFFNDEWEIEQGKGNEASDELLMLQKKAIIGYETEVNYFRSKIHDYLKKNNFLHEWYPEWYPDLVTAIFHENWGLAGVYKWTQLTKSSSAKIIGDRIYYLINGRQELQPQKISRERLNQLKKALLLRNPEKRLNENYAEVYMLDGTRITIYDEGLAKEPVIVFRKYIVEELTFEEQARLGTIPEEIIPMLKAQVKIGYNVGFIGPVRSGKTTFLETWQKYEDPLLEGIQIETDPEIPLHIIKPNAPVIQLVADGDKLKGITKNLLRGDGDYLIMAEARDGIALKIAMMVTAKGTRRVKLTFHTSDPIDFPFDVASEIVQEFGGNLWLTAIKVAKGYHYLFELTQLKDKSQKRLKGIYEIRYNPDNFEITVHQICKYDFLSDSWTFKYDIGKDKELIGYQEDYEAFTIFKNELKKLSEKYPMKENHIFKSAFSQFIGS